MQRPVGQVKAGDGHRPQPAQRLDAAEKSPLAWDGQRVSRSRGHAARSVAAAAPVGQRILHSLMLAKRSYLRAEVARPRLSISVRSTCHGYFSLVFRGFPLLLALAARQFQRLKPPSEKPRQNGAKMPATQP